MVFNDNVLTRNELRGMTWVQEHRCQELSARTIKKYTSASLCLYKKTHSPLSSMLYIPPP